MMRRPLIAANWKMFLNTQSGVGLAEDIVRLIGDVRERDVLICPSYPLLADVGRVIEKSIVMLGAQNMYFEKEGAFTGEVSPDMLLSVGCDSVLLGHSERRHVFNEEDLSINRKVNFALQSGLKPVLCVGELLEEREAGRTDEVVKNQVQRGLEGVDEKGIEGVVIAYEPVWAIGTGKTATPEDADSVHGLIREVVGSLYGGERAESIRILYGGSVKPENIDGLMAKRNIDGALVGGASLKAESFARIVKYEDV